MKLSTVMGIFRQLRLIYLRQNRSKRQGLAAAFLFILLIMWYIVKYRQPLKDVPVWVVDEHHEVLRYWYHQTVIGALNRTGNTLIHIDGHSDMAAPDNFHGVPFFRWPKGEHEVANLMQKNDVFIQAAMIIGLIDHIIWFFPSWDDTLGPDRESFYFDIGYHLIAYNNSQRAVFCECSNTLDKTRKPSGKKQCAFSDTTVNATDVEITPEQCHVMKTILVEAVVDDKIIDFLEERSWIKKPRSVLLDIDEDFFGCASGVEPLLETGVSWDLVKQIDVRIAALICAKNTLHEDLADRLLKDYITEFVKLCVMTDDGSHCVKDEHELRMVLDKYFMDGFDQSGSMFCAESFSEAGPSIAKFINTLMTLSLKKIKVILETGFCLNTSPATLDFDRRNSFSICHGANVPGDTLVTLYSPDQSDVDDRMKLLQDTLDILQEFDLKFVTIARSLRDGYTPRHLSNKIEKGILEYMESSRKTSRYKFSVHFDDNLLGGEGGWESRYLNKKHSWY